MMQDSWYSNRTAVTQSCCDLCEYQQKRQEEKEGTPQVLGGYDPRAILRFGLTGSATDVDFGIRITY